MDSTPIPIQCDIGFGDTITPSAVSSEIPTLLDQPATIPVGLTESYATEKAHQWNAFFKRSQLETPPLTEVAKELAAIYWPLLEKSYHH